jgi:hypothetical protein
MGLSATNWRQVPHRATFAMDTESGVFQRNAIERTSLRDIQIKLVSAEQTRRLRFNHQIHDAE